MNPSNYFKLLKKYRYIIVAIMFCVGATSYFLVRKLPDVYESQARLSTGIVDDTQQILGNVDNSQESKIKQAFSNLIQLIQLKRVLNQVSYQLMLHDITSDTPFRKPSKHLNQLNAGAKQHAIEVYKQKYKDAEPLSLWDNDQLGLHKLMVSMGYDDATLGGKLMVYRVNTSDFIEVSYESENPLLSAYIVNAVTKEFYEYYTFVVKENQMKALTFLEKLVKQKKDSLNDKVSELKSYKIQNRLLNLPEQARILYGQISDFETKRQAEESKIESNTGALKSIDARFSDKDKKYLEANISPLNSEIASLMDLVSTKSDEYLNSNNDPRLKTELDTLKSQLENKRNEASNRYLYSPLSSKQNLVAEKLKLDVNLLLAKNGVKKLTEGIGELNTKFDKLVPHEAVIQSYESAIDIAAKEYIELLQKYNQSSLESRMAIKLKKVEDGMPGDAKPTKKKVLVILSVIISFVLCLLVVFVLFFLDDSIKQPTDLANKTMLPVLGYLNKLKSIPADLTTLWAHTPSLHDVVVFNKLFRSIHFEVKADVQQAKTIAITSIKNGEGKTLFAIGLANCYVRTNKKVLLIDGNFSNPTISQILAPTVFIEDFFKRKNDTTQPFDAKNGIAVLGNRGGEYSAFELFDEEVISASLQNLYKVYDVIIIETDSMEALNKSKEWLLFSDKIVAVFQSGLSIKESKTSYVDFSAVAGQ